MIDLKAEARRLAEEAATKVHVQSTWEVQSDSIESALLAFGRLVREEDAKVAAEFSDPKDGPDAADDTAQVAREIAAAIRAKALE